MKKVQCPKCPKMLDYRGLGPHMRTHQSEFSAKSGSVASPTDNSRMDDIVRELKGSCRRQLEAIAILAGVDDYESRLSESGFVSNLIAL